jgi:hypothetical protein
MMKPNHKRLARRIGLSLGTALALVTVIHLPPLSGWLGITGGHGGGCPFGFDHEESAEGHKVAKARLDATLRGQTPALARPALGFTLDVTTVTDVQQWSIAHGLGCEAKHGGTLVECGEVPASALPRGAGALGLTSAWFQFGDHGTLESLKTVRRDPVVGAVSAAFDAVQTDVSARAGAPAKQDGSAAPEVLANGALRQAMVEYRFTDYRALVRATNMGNGFVLSEEYATLVD